MITIISKRSLSIDIGTKYVKCVQVRGKNCELIVEKYFILEKNNNIKIDLINNIKIENIKSKKTNISLPNSMFHYKNFRTPNMKIGDLKKYIKNNFQINKDYIYQYSIQNNYKDFIINKFGIKKDTINYYKRFILDLDCRCNSLGSNGYNIFKLLSWSGTVNEYYNLKSVNYLVLDLGYNYLDLIYVEKDYLIDIKSFDDFKELKSVNLVDFINIYKTSYPNINLIILIGGLSEIKGLKNEISMSTDIQTIKLEKLEKVKFPKKFNLNVYANALAANLDGGKVFYV